MQMNQMLFTIISQRWKIGNSFSRCLLLSNLGGLYQQTMHFNLHFIKFQSRIYFRLVIAYLIQICAVFSTFTLDVMFSNYLFFEYLLILFLLITFTFKTTGSRHDVWFFFFSYSRLAVLA